MTNSLVARVPTLAGFVNFLRQLGINTAVLPDDSVFIPFTYEVSLATVTRFLVVVPPLYTLAVYNLATDLLINYAEDVPDAPDVAGSNPLAPYFANLRNQFGVYSFVAGVVSGSGDNGTSQTLTVQKAADNFTLDDLQRLKTPYGRRYLELAQKAGPELWGVS